MTDASESNLRLARLPEVMAMVGVSKETLLVWMKQGLFPRPLLLGPRARAWRLSEIQQWIDTRDRVAYKAE